MKNILFILLLLPGLLKAQNLRRWGSTGAISKLHGDWFYNAHPLFGAGDSLKLVDFRLLKDTAAALRSAMGGSGMAIGGTVTSGTTGSVLFVGSSSVLAQDNSNFFWDNTNKRLGIGATPSYRLHIAQSATGQTADSRTINVSTTGSTFNTASSALFNHAGYFLADATKSPGGFDFTNVGVMGVATGGDYNWGIGVGNLSYTGNGYFGQTANNTTKIQGGPGTENVTFGPDNRIRLNATNVIVPSGSMSVGSNSDDGIGTLQVYGYETLYTADSTANPANMLWRHPVTKKLMLSAVPSGGSNFANANLTFTGNRTHTQAGYSLSITDNGNNTLKLDPANGSYQFGKNNTNGAYLALDTVSGLATLQAGNTYYMELDAVNKTYNVIMNGGYQFLSLDANNKIYKFGDISSSNDGNNTFLQVDDANELTTLNKQLKLGSYGSGTYSGTVTNYLAVTSNGTVVETATPTGTLAVINDADHTVTASESAIRYHNNITATRTVTIPNPSSATNREIWIKWNTIDGGAGLTITTTSGTALIYLDGTASSSSYNVTASFQSALLKSDGTSWYKIN
jgi:hypothetical protein